MVIKHFYKINFFKQTDIEIIMSRKTDRDHSKRDPVQNDQGRTVLDGLTPVYRPGLQRALNFRVRHLNGQKTGRAVLIARLQVSLYHKRSQK